MSPAKLTPPDADNPEWTDETFARARPAAEVLPPEILAQFKNTRGPQKAAKKVAVSIRLSDDVVAHFKQGGPGWQGRIDAALKQAIRNQAEGLPPSPSPSARKRA